ncbi:hypothetical protein B0H14DRAFT_70408 [Mycena olivaceomarginata]|nr:hypothetical protein B0H14DRAFT_70408 [Mycena olivaceomarginata]
MSPWCRLRRTRPSRSYTPQYTSSTSRTSPPTSFTMCTVPHTEGTPLGMSSAPLTSPCMPPSRTSLPLHIVCGAAHPLCTVHVAAHVPLSCTSPCAPSNLYTPPHMSSATCLPRGVHGAEHVPHIVHKGVYNSRFAHAPRHVAVHLPSVVVHGSGFVLVAARVPRVCCIAPHVPHGTCRRVRPRICYAVGVPVFIVHRTVRAQCAHAASRGRSPISYEHQQQRVHCPAIVHTFVHLYVIFFQRLLLRVSASTPISACKGSNLCQHDALPRPWQVFASKAVGSDQRVRWFM